MVKKYTPEDGLRNTVVFPTDPADEAAAREQIQGMFDQILAFHNAHLTDTVTDADGVHGLHAESGTFTPVLIGLTDAGTPTYVYQTGKYYRIGKLSNCNILIVISDKGNIAGGIAIMGLPFLAAGDGSIRYSASVAGAGFVSGLGEQKQIGGFVPGGSSTLSLVSTKYNSDTILLQDTDIDNNFTIQISVTYETI